VTIFPFFPQGDPTYLIVNNDGGIENYGLNAVCTHLGCVVPWVGVSCLALGLVCGGGAVGMDGVDLSQHSRIWTAAGSY
jgi:Rieske Fe-S protein